MAGWNRTISYQLVETNKIHFFHDKRIRDKKKYKQIKEKKYV